MGPVDELPPVKRAEAAQSCAFFAGAGAKLFVGSGYNFLLNKNSREVVAGLFFILGQMEGPG